MSDLGSFLVAKKNHLSDRLPVYPPDLDRELVVPLYPFAGFHRRETNKTVDDSGTDWASFAKGAGVQLRYR